MPKLSPREQNEFDKKHIKLIALGLRKADIASALKINNYDEGNNRKRLYAIHVFETDREVTIYAVKNKIITQADAEQTINPLPPSIDWTQVVDIP